MSTGSHSSLISDPPASPDRRLPSSQLRAFLAASEEIDIEPETVEELVQALIIEASADKESSGIRVSDGSDGLALEVSELDMSALYFLADEGSYIVSHYNTDIVYVFVSIRRSNLVPATNSRHDAPSQGER